MPTVKVDRLTRSLADFAKIVELFDSRKVSFVSVTQAFNTTTSMGRLTLNVLLSFAQFEREVTGERIRDKVAASKAKGLRMGGRPPLGYDVKDLRLVLNAPEAETVRGIFERYLALGSVNRLAVELRAEGIRGKRWIDRHGKEAGGGEFGRSPLYYLLSNVVYRGFNKHKEKLYPDCHPAIIDEELWTAVQTRLGETNGSRPSTPLIGAYRALRRKLYDDRGNPMIPVHTKKGGQRYTYYASRPPLADGSPSLGSLPRISAATIESLVADAVTPLLSPGWQVEEDAPRRVGDAIDRVILGADKVVLQLKSVALSPTGNGAESDIPIVFQTIPISLKSKKGATILEPAGEPSRPADRIDRAQVRAVVLAKRWAQLLATGQVTSVKALAKDNGLCEHYTAQVLPLAFLAPDLVGGILSGRQPRAVSLKALMAQKIPLNWDEQRVLFSTIGAR